MNSPPVEPIKVFADAHIDSLLFRLIFGKTNASENGRRNRVRHLNSPSAREFFLRRSRFKRIGVVTRERAPAATSSSCKR
jgi:hypothetical protein